MLALQSSGTGSTAELVLQPVGSAAVALGGLLLALTLLEAKDSCARLLYMKR